MPFFIAGADLSGNLLSGTIQQLIIAPTVALYPDRFDNVVRTSKDGNAIIQTPTKDSRTRKWIWRNYKTTVPKYNQLYSQILQFHYKLRLAAGLSPFVYIRDTETLNLNYLQYNGTTWITVQDFLQAKITQVTQNLLQQSGYPSYETIMEFYLSDSRYADF